MFNDALSVPEMRVSIGMLAECGTPFHRAHGRPSMVPLVRVGGADRNNRSPSLTFSSFYCKLLAVLVEKSAWPACSQAHVNAQGPI